jgi:hypothetical protein
VLRSQLFTTAASLKMSAFALGSAIAEVLAVHAVDACLLGASAAPGLAVAAVLALTAPVRRRREARRAPA